MNFSEHLDSDSGAGTLSQGAKVDCDHCDKTCKVLLIKQVTVIKLAPV